MAGGQSGGSDRTPIDAELRKAGGFGRFQCLMVITVVFGIMSVNLLTHGIAILELAPQEPGGYICKSEIEPNSYVCSPKDFCDQPNITYEVNYAGSEENIYNLYTRLGLVCKPKSAMAKIAMSCMVGIFLGVLIVPRIGDLIGRKPVFWTSLFVSLPALVLVAVTSSLLAVDIAVFLAGPCIIARMSCGFLMLMEQMERKHQAKVGAVIMVSEGLCQIIWVFYLKLISKNTFYFIYFAVALNLISVIVMYWIPESPRYLYGINNLEKCSEVLAYIAKANGVKDYQPAQFAVDYQIMVEDVDKEADEGRSYEQVAMTKDGDGAMFDSVLTNRDKKNEESLMKSGKDRKTGGALQKSGKDRKTTTQGRYMTVTKDRDGSIQEPARLTKVETVAYMHATVTGLRSTNLWVIGADRSQSIAIDELWTKKPVHEGKERTTMTLRQTQANNDRNTSVANISDEEDEVIEVPTKVMRGKGLCQGRTRINLIFMVCLWITASFCYNMIGIYMKYVPGTIYLNYTISGFSEIAAHVFTGLLYVKLTPRWTFLIGYSIATAGGACLIFQKQFVDNDFIIASFVLMAKFGISISMCACYVSTPFIFPVVLSGTAFGICNVFSRFFCILSPLVAEIDIPFPMEVFSTLSLAGCFFCLFISPSKEDEVRTTLKSRKTDASDKSRKTDHSNKSLL